jgi:hypothetical protein
MTLIGDLLLQCKNTAEARGQHDNYGFALAAQPGESKGQPDNNPSSQLIVKRGPARKTCSRRPYPGARTIPRECIGRAPSGARLQHAG